MTEQRDIRGMAVGELRVMAALNRGTGIIAMACTNALEQIEQSARQQGRGNLREDETAFVRLVQDISRALDGFDRRWLPDLPLDLYVVGGEGT